MLTKTVIAATILGLGAVPAWAQSAVERANAKTERAIEYRTRNCAPGNAAACERANQKDRDSIAYRNKHATAAQRDPDGALIRANAKDARSMDYRTANCPSGDRAACARANEKTKRAMAKRDAEIRD